MLKYIKDKEMDFGINRDKRRYLEPYSPIICL